MNNATSLLRLFDIAFLLPHAVLLLILNIIEYPVTEQIGDLRALVSGDSTVVGAVVVITVAYVLGLICHGIQRGVNEAVWQVKRQQQNSARHSDSKRQANGPPAWYAHLEVDGKDQLATYCWYMRATSWNLLVALVIGVWLSYCRYQQVPAQFYNIGIGILCMGILAFLGYDFDRAHKDISKPKAKTQSDVDAPTVSVKAAGRFTIESE